jgi:hypothetical protein
MFVPPLRNLNYTNLDHYMNENSAEHHTAEALRLSGYTVRNACILTRAHHYHFAPKMHKGTTHWSKTWTQDTCGRGFPERYRTYPCEFYRPGGEYVVSTVECERCAEESDC